MKQRHNTTIWWILIGVTTVFIWGQSLLGRELSTLQSDSVQGMLGQLFGEWIYDTFFYQHIRKVAHFAEYALLGAEWVALFLTSRHSRPLHRHTIVLAGPAVATCDELLQFVSARAPRVTDVLLDCAGYACGGLVVWAVCTLTRRCRQK